MLCLCVRHQFPGTLIECRQLDRGAPGEGRVRQRSGLGLDVFRAVVIAEVDLHRQRGVRTIDYGTSTAEAMALPCVEVDAKTSHESLAVQVRVNWVSGGWHCTRYSACDP